MFLIKKNFFLTKLFLKYFYKFSGDDNLRIALIYVMNDVVQKSTTAKKDKKTSNDMVKMAFHPHVVNAFGMAG